MRFFEPPGLRAGPSAHPRSAQPEHDDPAPGFRTGANGISGGVGHNGFSWSSAENGVYGLFLWFNSEDLNICRADYRTSGRQLRCLSE